jgi:hypothetical protein
MTFKKNILGGIVLAGILLPFAYLGVAIVRLKVPASVKLCHLGNGNANFQLVWPKGSHFNLVVGSPDARSNFFATLNVVAANEDGVRILNDATSAPTPSNWLQHEGLNGYIISSLTNAEKMPNPGSAVDFSVFADGVVCTNMSLWLTYLRPAAWSK